MFIHQTSWLQLCVTGVFGGIIRIMHKIRTIENQFGQVRSLNPNYLMEIEKDKWDVRELGIPFIPTRSDYYIIFTRIHIRFRHLVKRYVKHRVIDSDSIKWNTAIQDVSRLNVFFRCIHQLHPDWEDLIQLSRSDIESYIDYVRNNPMGGESTSQYRNQDPTDNYIWSMVATVENFIYFMQRYEWSESPIKSVRSLVYQEDRPKIKPRNILEFKYMSDYIWRQIIENISYLDKQYVPIVMLMEATGLHLIDVLNLKLDCLISGKDGTWIKSERTKFIKVPITVEIENLVKAQEQLIKDLFSDNPDQFLFLRYKGKSAWRGKPYLQASLIRQLNIFAVNQNICQEDGKIFHFGSLVFRHRFGLTQINNGMSINDVQRLIANVTPQMAFIYSKIHDFTQQKHWEDSLYLSAFRIDAISGKVVESDINEQAFENDVKLDWLKRNIEELRLDHGYCIKSPRTHCQYLNQMMDLPCITFKCSSFYVDSSFLDYYNEQINDLKKRVEECKLSNRMRLLEILEPKLTKYLEIRNELMNYNISKRDDEHVTELET